MEDFPGQKIFDRSQFLIAIVITITLTALVAGSAMYFWQQRSQRESPAAQNNVNVSRETVTDETKTVNAADNDAPKTTKTTITRVSDPGVTWLSTPESLQDQGYVIDKNNYGFEASYYKIADLQNGGELIFVDIPGYEMLGLRLRFQKNADDTVELLRKHSDNIDDEILRGDIDISDTMYQSLTPPTYLTVASTNFQQASGLGDTQRFFSKVDPQPEKIGETNYGDFYRQLNKATEDDAIFTRKFMLVLADTTVIYYTSKNDFVLDDGSIDATWNTQGQTKKDMIVQKGLATGGCGIGPYDQIYRGENLAQRLTAVGTTSTGSTLYDVKDSTDPLLTVAHDVYAQGRTDPVSKEKFIAAAPLLLWKDALGDTLVFESTEYAPFAECGKPVVYLYPEQEMNVTVRVGANVTKSEPAYDDGWQVHASPSGVLQTRDGDVVNSLFWEGKGHGWYPAVQYGKVVAHDRLLSTLRNDLRALGLTPQESRDFLTFWLPRMPNTPYIRLTWFGTSAMNVLAPLTIQPTPDTVIRVFLDFEGVHKKTNTLQPQILTSKERKGFTVVEWGGLLTE